MEEDNDFVFFVTAFAWTQTPAFYLLLKECKSRHRRWWMLLDKRKRSWEYTPLCFWSTNARMKNFHEEFFKMTRFTVEQFEELLNLLSPALIKSSSREFLDPEFRLAFTVW